MNAWSYGAIKVIAVAAATIAAVYLTGTAWALMGLVFMPYIADCGDKRRYEDDES